MKRKQPEVIDLADSSGISESSEDEGRRAAPQPRKAAHVDNPTRSRPSQPACRASTVQPLRLTLTASQSSQPCGVRTSTSQQSLSLSQTGSEGNPGSSQAHHRACDAEVNPRSARPGHAKRPPLHLAKPALCSVAEGSTCAFSSSVPHAAPFVDQASTSAGPTGLWVDKHSPGTLDELLLAVHKKKVQEVQDWLEHQLPGAYGREYCRLMIVTGPPGCCKSTCIKLLAHSLGFNIVEWTPPPPTMWAEHKYQASYGSDQQYVSKLEEFEMFVSRAKYPPLSLVAGSSDGAMSQSQRPSAPQLSHRTKLMLIDDLPHAADADGRKRLTAALVDLVRTARCPVMLVTTESSSAANSTSSGTSAAAGTAKGLHKDILAGLQAVGAMIASFNPITVASTSKVLMRIAEKEGIQLSTAAASSIASVAEGDLRNAVQTFQMLYQQHAQGLGQGLQQGLLPSKKGRKGTAATSKRAVAAAAKAVASRPLAQGELTGIAQAQRDQGLQLFHALGKVLYNKRGGTGDDEEDEEQGGGGEGGSSRPSQPAAWGRRGTSAAATARAEAAAQVKAQQQRADAPGSWMSVVAEMSAGVTLPASQLRPAMRYDPESLLLRSSLEALGATAFLHENYLSFIAEEAMEDVAQAAANLSDAGFLACFGQGNGNDNTGFSGMEDNPDCSVMQACAGSIATRGLMFANQHPAPRRFLPLKAPATFTVARACEANQAVLQGVSSRLALLHGTAPAGGSGQMSAQLLPHLRHLAAKPSYAWLSSAMPTQWSQYWNGSVSVVQQGDPGQGRQARGRQAAALDPQLAGMVDGMSLSAGDGDGDEGDGAVDDPIEEEQ